MSKPWSYSRVINVRLDALENRHIGPTPEDVWLETQLAYDRDVTFERPEMPSHRRPPDDRLPAWYVQPMPLGFTL
jgi:hypothetical protein